MRFTSLKLRNFRNYPQLALTPGEGVTVLYGQNGAGKTNVLEAMHLLSLGRSHRTAQDREMIRSGEAFARVCAETRRRDGRHQVEVRLFANEKPQKRLLLHDKPAERIGDLMGHVTCVMFAPEDVRIARDGPAARRRFVDMQLSQIRPRYLHALRRYLSALESRNALLKELRITPAREFALQLDAWDEQLALAAEDVVADRRWFVEALAREAGAQYRAICEDADEALGVRYKGTLADCADVRARMLEALREARGEDKLRQFTSVGPHRDDLELTLSGRELRAFGSQGQLRTAALSLKLGELTLIERELGEPPALLLDDVFSELDVKRRAALLRNAAGVQTFLTCTDRADAAGAHAEQFLRVTRDERGAARLEE